MYEYRVPDTYLPRNQRILSPCISNLNDLELVQVFADAYPAAYHTLYHAKPITCSVTGTTFDAVPVPCAAILDVSGLAMIPTAYDCFFFSISSFLPFLNCMLLEQSVEIQYR